MKSVKHPWKVTLVALGLAWCTSGLVSAEENPWTFLPTRVLDIEGGAVSFQSAVVVDTTERLANPLLQRYPMKYILPTTNDSDFPIWIDVEWRVPGQKPFRSSGNLEAKRFGTFFVKSKEVAWDTAIPVMVTIYGDKKKTRKLGGREVVLLFHGDESDKQAFTRLSKRVNTIERRVGVSFGRDREMPLLPGFQEMIDLSKPVTGTAADTQLTEDIKLLLWKEQSRTHWDCTHEILGAKPFDATEIPKLSDAARGLLEKSQGQGNLAPEQWQIKSCGGVATYLVLMGRAKGGTDVAVVRIEESRTQ